MFGFFDFTGPKKEQEKGDVSTAENVYGFEKFKDNPILKSDKDISWKAKAVYNPAAIYLDQKIHLVYRGQSNDGVSSFGYAVSEDGFKIKEDLDEPIYRPSADFEFPTKEGWNSGCEDPRITKIEGRLYMTYTAYDGTNPPRVALTSISINDFLSRNFVWEAPKLISPPGVDDKDACIIKDDKLGLIAFHRLGNSIWIDKLKNLEFPEVKFLTGGILAQPRSDSWDNLKIGMAAPPIVTEKGFLLFYHALCDPGFSYKIGAMLLSFDDPHKILARSSRPLLEPEMPFEKDGQIPNAVFSCGAVVKEGLVFLYYGGADTVTCVATVKLSSLLDMLINQNV